MILWKNQETRIKAEFWIKLICLENDDFNEKPRNKDQSKISNKISTLKNIK